MQTQETNGMTLGVEADPKRNPLPDKMPEVQMGKKKMTSSGEMPIPQMGIKNLPVYNKPPENGGIENQTLGKMPKGEKTISK